MCNAVTPRMRIYVVESVSQRGEQDKEESEVEQAPLRMISRSIYRR